MSITRRQSPPSGAPDFLALVYDTAQVSAGIACPNLGIGQSMGLEGVIPKCICIPYAYRAITV